MSKAPTNAEIYRTLLDVKSDVSKIHEKLDKSNEILSAHGARIHNVEKAENRFWYLTAGTILALIAGVINFFIKK